ncbi:MAG: hypothetical protein H0T89_13250 [Deltaproteobacteria bacterium]|nr:hypothetical protein [Deltaproteobacteria bacterium]
MSRMTYERLKAFCEANNISMSQLVETRVNDFLGEGSTTTVIPTSTPRPAPAPARPSPMSHTPTHTPSKPSHETSAPRPAIVPMTSAAARYAVEPPPPIIKPKQETAAPKPAEKRPEQIFTF